MPTSRTATLTAATVWGALRGLETFSQLVYWDLDLQRPADPEAGYVLRWAPWVIDDAPRFKHRGVLIDTARHYLSVATIMRQIDAVAFCKMNTLHWHAVDGDAFPIRSDAFPQLAEMGAYSPVATYSKEQVAAVVDHARFRGVRIVVEFDVPGHSTAWSLGLPDLFISCPPSAARGDFGGITRMLDPTDPKAYAFLDALIAEMAPRFPDNVMHFGGDEVDLHCWNASATVQRWLAAHPGKTVTDLYVEFELKLHAIAARHNKSVSSWADVFLAANATKTALPPGSVAQVWGRSPSVADVARAGVGSVRSTGYYLNGGFSTGGCAVVWESIYNDDPMPEGLTPAEEAHVLGGEAAMWGEITDDFNIDSKLWFRAAVLAERYWSSNASIAAQVTPWPASYTSPDINARMIRHRCRLLQRGIQAQPYSTLAVTARSRWSQCELFLPPSHSHRQ